MASFISKYLSRVSRKIHRPKVFCVGCNKTGTTSLETALKEFGFRMGEQVEAEHLAVQDWPRRDFKRLIRFCRSRDAFQDVPFSLPFTFQALDHAFPGSLFILTERTTPEQWYSSIVRFHTKLWGKNGSPPTADDLANASYHSPGWAWHMNRAMFDSPTEDPYRESDLIRFYRSHNSAVKTYFRHRPGDLLTLDVAGEDAYGRLCEFLAVPKIRDRFPWENKT